MQDIVSNLTIVIHSLIIFNCSTLNMHKNGEFQQFQYFCFFVIFCLSGWIMFIFCVCCQLVVLKR